MTLPKVSLFVMTLLSILVALASYRFLVLGLPLAFPDMPGNTEFSRAAFLLHVSFSPAALILGSLQLMPRLRTKYPAFHRWTGRLYAVSVLLGGVSGLVVALGVSGGISAQLGFSILAVLWLITTAQGVRFARARQFVDHRRWMVRSFALTFAGVALRLYLLGFFAAGFSYTSASVYLAWMCWIPNLIAVEWWRLRRA